jgi:hypothetical protein
MKERDKRKSHIRSKDHMINVSSSSVRRPVTETFTTLHYTSPNFTSLHLSTLNFFPFKLHQTTLHFTTLVDTSLPLI